jgi:hypothetical protein
VRFRTSLGVPDTWNQKAQWVFFIAVCVLLAPGAFVCPAKVAVFGVGVHHVLVSVQCRLPFFVIIMIIIMNAAASCARSLAHLLLAMQKVELNHCLTAYEYSIKYVYWAKIPQLTCRTCCSSAPRTVASCHLMVVLTAETCWANKPFCPESCPGAMSGHAGPVVSTSMRMCQTGKLGLPW